MISIFDWILIACWAAFLIYWMYSAVGAKRNVRTGYARGIFLRVGFVVVVILLLHAGILPTVQFSLFSTSTIALSIIGDLCAIAGTGLAIWARWHLGSNWGMPMSVKEKADLITTGPYSLVRHPIYTGVLLSIVGSALVAGPWWLIIFIVAGMYFIVSALQEEKIMLKEFPEQYPAYKKHTWMLVPFVF